MGELRQVFGYGDPDCPVCHGVGYLRQDLPISDPNFGKIWKCDCMKQVSWDDDLGISREEACEYNWDEYMQTEAVKVMRRHYDKVLEVGHGWLYFHGEPGNGKSIMARACAVYVYQVLGMQTRYRKQSEIMNVLRASYDSEYGQEVYKNRMKELADVPVLIVDELGRDRATDFGKQSLSDMLDARYQKAILRKGITVWVSNYPPEDVLERYQIDRVRDGRFQVVKVEGASVRPVMKPREAEGNYWWNKD